MKKYLLSIAILLLVVFVYSCKDENDDEKLDDSVIFTGKLLDKQDIAIPFAEVEFYEEAPTEGKAKPTLLGDKFVVSDTTDEEGNFNVTIPDNENIYMVIIHQDFQNKKYKVKDVKNKDGLTLLKGDKEIECTATLNIELIDEAGNAISDAYIKLSRENKLIKKAKTNDKGKFSFEEVCPGTYEITALKNDNSVSESNYKIVSDETYNLSMKMQQQDKDSCCEGSILINLKDKDSGDKVNGTVVLKKEGKENKSKKTDDGSTKFEELCEGKYTIVIETENHERMEFAYEIDCNQEYEITKELSKKEEKDSCCEGIIKFFPIGKDGNVINGAKVYIYKDGKVIEDPVVKDGKAVTDGLCEGKYTIVIKAEGYENIEYTIELGCDETVESEKEMTEKKKEEADSCCDGSLQFLLKDKDSGDKINGTIILIKEGKESKSKKTDDAYAKFEELCEGKYTIIIETENHERMEFAYEVECDKEYELTKELSKKDNKDSCCEGIMKFYPIGKDGNVINGAKVHIYKDGKVIEDPVVKEDGKAFADGLCEGKYTIVIKAEGYEDIEYTIELGCNKTVESEKEMTEKKKEEADSCCDGSLQFLLKDKDSGDKINGTVILKKEGKESKTKKTDDGYAKFEELCEGKYTVIIETENHERMEFAYEVDCDKEYELTKELTKKEEEEDCCEGILWIGLSDKDGNLIKGKVVIKKDGKEYGSKSTENSAVTFLEMCKGKYNVIIETEEHKRMEFLYEQGCNDTTEISKTLEIKESDDCCDNTFTVYTKDEKDNSNLSDVIVKLWKDGKVVKEGKTKDGKVVFEGLCKGKYSGSITKETYTSSEFNVEFDCKESKELSKSMKKKESDCCDAKLKLQTKDENGNALADVEIEYWLGGEKVSSGKSNGDGYYYGNDLCLGKYTIVLKKDGYNSIETNIELKECKQYFESFNLKK